MYRRLEQEQSHCTNSFHFSLWHDSHEELSSCLCERQVPLATMLTLLFPNQPCSKGIPSLRGGGSKSPRYQSIAPAQAQRSLSGTVTNSGADWAPILRRKGPLELQYNGPLDPVSVPLDPLPLWSNPQCLWIQPLEPPSNPALLRLDSPMCRWNPTPSSPQGRHSRCVRHALDNQFH